MKSGYFFKLDENARIDKGMVIFRYMDFISESVHGNNLPIYLVLKPESINIYIHRLEYVESEKTTEHQNALLFSLPLTPNINHSIDEELRLLYDTPFEIFEEEIIKYCPNIITYSSLNVFGLDQKIKSNDLNKNDRKNTINTFYRKLLLDFIFDLEHHTVFENSPHYEVVASRLRDCFFFRSIAAKAEYYYQCHQFESLLKNDKIVKNSSTTTFHAKTLFFAEKEWLSILNEKQGDKVIRPVNEWFKIIETEHKEVFIYKITNKNINRNQWLKGINIKEIKYQNNISVETSSKWFLQRYDLYTAFRILNESSRLRIDRIIFFIILGYILFFLFLFDTQKAAREIELCVISIIIYIPFALIFSFIILTLSVEKEKRINIISTITLPRLFMAIASSWIILLPSEDLWRTNFDINIANLQLIIFELIMIFILFVFIIMEIRKKTIGYIPKNIKSRTLNILLIGICYSLLIGLIGGNLIGKRTLVRDQYLQTYFTEAIKIYNKNKASIDTSYLKIHQPATIYPNLNVTIENNILLGDKVIQVLKDKSLNINDELFILLKNTEAPGKVDIIDTKIMYLFPDNPWCQNKGFYLYCFPGMLIIQSIFALFIGIFLQLIFNERPVTESF